MFPFVGGYSSTFRNLVSCSFLTFCLCSLICVSCGDHICGILALRLPAYTNVVTADGAILPFIIFSLLTLAYGFYGLSFW
jgi:hypothetical protein